MEIVIGLVVGTVMGAALGWSLASGHADRRVRRAEVAAAQARAVLDAERRDGQRLTEHVTALAADALRANSEQFLAVAEERLRRSQDAGSAELARREEAVRQLVEPLTRTLDQVKLEMTSAERARLQAHAQLSEQIRAMRGLSEQVRTETAQLVNALRAPQVRGRWGEMQLRRIVEAAGMVEHVHFDEQSQVATPDGALKPDMVVHLTGGKCIVIDAKVPFLGYLEAMEARDDAARAERLRAHARHLRAHIDSLAKKAYWEHFDPTPEFVVLFVPAEAFLYAALEEDPTLQERAFEANVVIATPSTLVSLLRTVAYTWRQDALAANAQEVLKVGKELHGRLATMGGHIGRLGRQLDGAVAAYNDSVSSLESRVLVSARRLASLKVTDAELDAPVQIERTARQLQAPELVASQTQAVVAIEDAR